MRGDPGRPDHGEARGNPAGKETVHIQDRHGLHYDSNYSRKQSTILRLFAIDYRGAEDTNKNPGNTVLISIFILILNLSLSLSLSLILK